MVSEAAREIWRGFGDNIPYALGIGSVTGYVEEGLGTVILVPREADRGECDLR